MKYQKRTVVDNANRTPPKLSPRIGDFVKVRSTAHDYEDIGMFTRGNAVEYITDRGHDIVGECVEVIHIYNEVEIKLT